MKTQSWKMFTAALALVLAALACANPLNGGGTLPDGDAIATTVAETLTAAVSIGDEETEVPPGDPSDEPPAATDPAPTDAPAGGSPDVLRVAYGDEADLWIWTEGVGSDQVYTGDRVTDVLFSDDGSLVAFKTSTENYRFTGIWAVNVDGSNLRRLVTADEINVLVPLGDALRADLFQWQFVPGTHTLAFNTRLHYEGPGLDIQDDLRLLNIDTGVLSTLFDVGQAGMFYYSPDGSQIALVKPGEIDLVNADGSNRREDVLVHPHVNTASEYQFYAIPRWHAGGSQLSVIIPSAEPFGDDPSMAVWTVPTDGSGASLESTFPTSLALFDSDILQSPDFSKVIYLEQVGEPTDNTWELHIANQNGSGDINFYTGQMRFTNWNPDSSWFVFKENNEYFLGQVGSDGIWPLADTLPVFEMAWIDSGRYLYFSGSYGAFDLRIGSFAAPSYSIAGTNSEFPVFDISN